MAIQWRLIQSHMAVMSKNRYDFPINFYTLFFMKAWHMIFQELLDEYFKDFINKEISTIYFFLENILMVDLSHTNDGKTFTSDIYRLIPNTNLSRYCLQFNIYQYTERVTL